MQPHADLFKVQHQENRVRKAEDAGKHIDAEACKAAKSKWLRWDRARTSRSSRLRSQSSESKAHCNQPEDRAHPQKDAEDAPVILECLVPNAARIRNGEEVLRGTTDAADDQQEDRIPKEKWGGIGLWTGKNENEKDDPKKNVERE